MTTRTTGGYPVLYILSTLFFLMALAGVVILIVTDLIHHLSFSIMHQRLDALPLMMIGLSYITSQLATKRNRSNILPGIFIGIAFLLWGGEQLLPPSQIVTFMDEGAVSIFVIDVSFIIWGRISLNNVSGLP